MIINGKKVQLKIFDFAIIFIFIFLLISLFFVLFRKQSKINVVVKVNEESMAYQIGGVPNWFAQFLHVGMKEVDVFGKPMAEIKEIKTYYASDQRSVVYLVVSLKAVYSVSNRQHTYKGKKILVGSTIQLPLNNLLVNGLIIDIDGSIKNNLKKISAEAKIRTIDPTFPQTEGVPPYIANSIQQGDVMKDSLGRPAIKIVKKTEEDAKMTVVTANGDVILQRQPLRKDVSLDLEIWGEKIGDRYFLFGDMNFPIIVSNNSVILNNYNTIGGLPFNVNNGLIWLTITKINGIQ
ncbi:MAG: hypothetical protein NUV58_02125 [Candidatus Roizmanbacteria bacterium]|nr:hypothetical protein [Candidatus Roizmanbacteria bacterium]